MRKPLLIQNYGLQVVATIAGALIVDKYGRRCLLISSGVIMALSISSLGAYFYVLNHLGQDEAQKISFLPLPSLCLYVLAFSLGFGAIPWLMMSELMAPEVKSLSSSIAGKYVTLNLERMKSIVLTFCKFLTKIFSYFLSFSRI